ncbi:hypothetical protein [Nocardioides alcanivorans]|uniref:hypothetical protein n=1 Tax=Nocardioides alcanivorans TaxID=2897352 RepID=UPI001F43AA42|nr:hypothetical protein [Nocardioides alcanivorans]
MKRASSLTSRLTITVVLLVALVCVAIVSLTTVAMRNQLTEQLDQDVAATLQRVERAAGDQHFPASLPRTTAPSATSRASPSTPSWW